jgi:hypothetical protein
MYVYDFMSELPVTSELKKTWACPIQTFLKVDSCYGPLWWPSCFHKMCVSTKGIERGL